MKKVDPTPNPIRELIWSIGNGTNEQALCSTLSDFFRPLCPLADFLDGEICVDYKRAYVARCGSGAFRFAGEGTFLYLTLSLIWVLSCALFLRHKKIAWIPDSAVTICVGWITGGLLSVSQSENSGTRRRFDEQIFFDILLPFIIFEAGYNMNRTAMRERLGLVLALAIFGTFISFFVTTGLMIGFAKLGEKDLPMLDAMTFAALISSTDPVAVVAVFAQFGVPQGLYTIIFGESTLNDAVAVALYGSLKWAYQNPHLAKSEKVAHLMMMFVSVSAGSIVIGLVCGGVVALAWKRIPIFVLHPVLETLVYLISALLPYYIADSLGWSGVISILFAALMMAAFAHPNLSKQTGIHVTFMVECLSRLFEAAIFGYLGTQMVINSEKLVWSPLALGALVAVLIARACNVFPIIFINNCLSSSKVPLKHQLMIWFSGLRGALAFALAVTVPEYDKVTQLGSHWSGEMLAWTSLIIVVNVFMFGACTPFMLEYLKIAGDESPWIEGEQGQNLQRERNTWVDRWIDRVGGLLFAGTRRRQHQQGDVSGLDFEQREEQEESGGTSDEGYIHITSRLAQSPPTSIISPEHQHRAPLLSSE